MSKGGKKMMTCRCEADQIDHAVDEGFDLHVDLFVPFLFDVVEVLCRVLVYEGL